MHFLVHIYFMVSIVTVVKGTQIDRNGDTTVL